MLIPEESIIEASPSSTTITIDNTEKKRKLNSEEDILSLIQLAENSSLVGTMLLEEAVNVSNEITSTCKIASKVILFLELTLDNMSISVRFYF